jgi:hypothetical protein
MMFVVIPVFINFTDADMDSKTQVEPEQPNNRDEGSIGSDSIETSNRRQINRAWPFLFF